MCDKCERWQHQICALFNFKRDDSKDAEYTCPKCYVQEIEHGLRIPLPQSAVLGAKDLPRTVLSDHIEERLFKRLREERHERAIRDGKSFDEVSAACSIYRILRLWILCFLFLGYMSWFLFPEYEICGLCTS